MRNHKAHRSLKRPARQRKALLRSLARELILHGRIETTEAKAKEVRPFAEKLVTEAGKNTLASVRRIESRVGEQARKRLCEEIAPAYANRSGGYTRVVKLPYRESDGASMAVIEFVDA